LSASSTGFAPQSFEQPTEQPTALFQLHTEVCVELFIGHIRKIPAPLRHILKSLYNYLMKTIESQPTIQEPLPEKYARILDGPPINDYTLRQVQLAVERFGLEHPSDTLDKNTLEDTIMAWSDVNSPTHYSELWNKFVKHPDFTEHPRFHGDYSRVTLKELELFKKNDCKNLPE